MIDPFGLAPLKVEGSYSIILPMGKYAVNNAKDRLIQIAAKYKFIPSFMEHELGGDVQVIATKRKCYD